MLFWFPQKLGLRLGFLGIIWPNNLFITPIYLFHLILLLELLEFRKFRQIIPKNPNPNPKFRGNCFVFRKFFFGQANIYIGPQERLPFIYAHHIFLELEM